MPNNTIRIFGTINDSIVDGPGFRYVVFTQGCYHNCKGCHNQESHDIHGGYDKNITEILAEIDANPLLDGVTLSGGEPILQTKPLLPLVKEINKRNLNIVLYSGYTYEQIVTMDEDIIQLLSLCDMLVDGKFELSKRSLALLYRGSSNQRLINIKQSLSKNTLIEYEPDAYGEIEIIKKL